MKMITNNQIYFCEIKVNKMEVKNAQFMIFLHI